MADPHPQTPMEKRINAILGELIAQRRLLQGSPTDRTLLASNGASIAYWQSKLRQAAAEGREQPRPPRVTLGGMDRGQGRPRSGDRTRSGR